jgi:hypothetical protein
MGEPVCTGVVQCVWAFQTLITGIVAVLSAIVTAATIYFAARLPVSAEREREKESAGRRLRLRSLEMSEELKLLGKRARLGQSTVKVHKASNADVTEATRQKMRLRIPEPTQDWRFMSLLPENMARECLQLNSMIEDHNFDIERAGGAFGDDNFGRSITDRLETIRTKAEELSNVVLIRDEDDYAAGQIRP